MWKPNQLIFVDDQGNVWDVTDAENPVPVYPPEVEPVLDLTPDDRRFMAALRIAIE